MSQYRLMIHDNVIGVTHNESGTTGSLVIDDTVSTITWGYEVKNGQLTVRLVVGEPGPAPYSSMVLDGMSHAEADQVYATVKAALLRYWTARVEACERPAAAEATAPQGHPVLVQQPHSSANTEPPQTDVPRDGSFLTTIAIAHLVRAMSLDYTPLMAKVRIQNALVAHPLAGNTLSELTAITRGHGVMTVDLARRLQEMAFGQMDYWFKANLSCTPPNLPVIRQTF